MSRRTTPSRTSSSRRSPRALRRPGLFLGAATAGALLVGVVTTVGEPAAQAEAPVTRSASVAERLGIPEQAAASPAAAEQLAGLEQLAASRSERDVAEQAAAAARAEADRVELERLAAEEAARVAAEEEARRVAEEEAARAAAEEAARQEAARQEAERVAAEEAARAAAAAPKPAPKPAAAAAPAAQGSFKDYALGKLGGDTTQFGCLEKLWGKESGWNPNAQNPTSTAYGIAQFLDSTWASTGIAKTSDGYRQIDAGLIYIENRYGSPCAAWSHSQAKGWY